MKALWLLIFLSVLGLSLNLKLVNNLKVKFRVSGDGQKYIYTLKLFQALLIKVLRFVDSVRIIMDNVNYLYNLCCQVFSLFLFFKLRSSPNRGPGLDMDM